MVFFCIREIAIGMTVIKLRKLILIENFSENAFVLIRCRMLFVAEREKNQANNVSF